jgi:hypothetical protein
MITSTDRWHLSDDTGKDSRCTMHEPTAANDFERTTLASDDRVSHGQGCRVDSRYPPVRDSGSLITGTTAGEESVGRDDAGEEERNVAALLPGPERSGFRGPNSAASGRAGG